MIGGIVWWLLGLISARQPRTANESMLQGVEIAYDVCRERSRRFLGAPGHGCDPARRKSSRDKERIMRSLRVARALPVARLSTVKGLRQGAFEFAPSGRLIRKQLRLGLNDLQSVTNFTGLRIEASKGRGQRTAQDVERGRARLVRLDGAQHCRNHVRIPSHQGILLGGKVVEECPRGDSRLQHDLFDADRIEAAQRDKTRGRGAQSLPGGALLALAQPAFTVSLWVSLRRLHALFLHALQSCTRRNFASEARSLSRWWGRRLGHVDWKA